jgi:DNA-binding XRE family transcriptional regulator
MASEIGYVYVLTNEWSPGLTKLGATTDVETRFSNLSSVLPGRSTLEWSTQTKDHFEAESQVRDVLKKFSIRSSRDWFSCPPRLVIEQFQICLEKFESIGILESLGISDKANIDNLADLGRYCRSWRKKAGIKQSELADMCGVGLRFISEFETGKPTCQFDMCIAVAKIIGVDLVAVKRGQS